MKKVLSVKASSANDQYEEEDSDEVLFWVNKSGFPISEHLWDNMFDFASKLHPTGASSVNVIKNMECTTPVPIPRPPLHLTGPADKSVEAVQNYMNELQYNHTGTQFYDIKKYKALSSLSETAREMIKESLPIKCLEAVILGIYLTNGVSGLERYPLGFRSVFGSSINRHVVLVVSWNGLFGALGMSRREDLMYKPLQFTSLGDLVIDYVESYNQYWHKVDKVKIGFPVSHNPQSHETIHWKGLTVNPSKMTPSELKKAVDKHAKEIRLWVRQAPIGTSYAPRAPVSTKYPSPTASQQLPNKTKSTNHQSSSSLSTSTVLKDRSPTSLSSKSNQNSSSSPNKQQPAGKDFEMRI